MYHCISSQIVKSLYDSFLVEYCIREKCLQKTVDNIFGPCKTFVLMIPSNGLNCNKINPLHHFKKRKRKMEALNYLNEGKFKGAFILIRFWPKFICSYLMFINVNKDMTRTFFLKQRMIKLCIISTIVTDAQILFDHWKCNT